MSEIQLVSVLLKQILNIQMHEITDQLNTVNE